MLYVTYLKHFILILLFITYLEIFCNMFVTNDIISILTYQFGHYLPYYLAYFLPPLRVPCKCHPECQLISLLVSLLVAHIPLTIRSSKTIEFHLVHFEQDTEQDMNKIKPMHLHSQAHGFYSFLIPYFSFLFFTFQY